MIGGLAGGASAGIFLPDNGKLALRGAELANDQAHPVDDLKAITAQLAWLGESGPVTGRGPLKPVSLAMGPSVLGRQVAAGNVKHGIAVEIAIGAPKSAECDLIGVPQKPGGLMIQRGHAFLELTNAKQDTETPALRS